MSALYIVCRQNNFWVALVLIEKIATEQFLLEATNIDIDACNKENVYNLRVLRHALDTYVRGIEFGGHHNAVDGWNGIDKDLTRATSKSPFDTVQDYRNCIKRLKAFPHQVSMSFILF